jgi:hypothetical protein
VESAISTTDREARLREVRRAPAFESGVISDRSRDAIPPTRSIKQRMDVLPMLESNPDSAGDAVRIVAIATQLAIIAEWNIN